MSTRSDIIVQRRDGTWKRIYCHSDGYLEHNGKLLAAHYNSQERAEAVVAPGDMSFLQERCDGATGHSFDNHVAGQSVYYGRDRGEKDVDGHVGASLHAVWPEAGSWTEYTYVWRKDEAGNAAWYVGDADEGAQSLVLLSLALAGISQPKPDIKAPWGVIGHRS